MTKLISSLIAAVLVGGLVSVKLAFIMCGVVLVIAYVMSRDSGPATGLASY